MKLISWNLNGIKARHDRLLALLDRSAPDVVLLQELKSEDATFPGDGVRARGYELHTHGQKAYHGVALLARAGATDVRRGLEDGVDDPQARLISGVIGGVRFASVYAPNGERVGSEKFAYKLAFYARLVAWARARVAEGPLVLGGDFNVAPADRDVHDPDAWRGQVLCSDDERAALARLCDAGLSDALRALDPERVAFTWWDYRMLGFQKNRGVRIDHFLVTVDVRERLVSFDVDRAERKGQQPSDHAPIVLSLR
ncbi:MAG: exodeoxyribonuclease III [Polyangiaceae bacterium]|nr:exodeoxyribonuclease III [Polyangiaceae bacterium]